MTTRKTFAYLAAASALIIGLQMGVAGASPVGSSYSMSGGNFPTNFAGAGPLTFNNVGDTSAETVPGVGLDVVEAFAAGAGSHGGDIVGFQFTLTGAPTGDQPFAFSINGLGFGPGTLSILGAAAGFDFGVSSFNVADATPFLTAVFGTALDLTFASPVTWDQIFNASNPPAGSAPTQIVVSLFLEVQQTQVAPEPSTLLLLGLGLVAMVVGVRAARTAPGKLAA